MIKRFLANYMPRHRNRVNQAFHIVGVPLSFVAPVVLLIEGFPWWSSLGCFVAGYMMQFVGHAFEGNDAGEICAIKKWLGKPYVEIAPDPKASKSDG